MLKLIHECFDEKQTSSFVINAVKSAHIVLLSIVDAYFILLCSLSCIYASHNGSTLLFILCTLVFDSQTYVYSERHNATELKLNSQNSSVAKLCLA